MAARGAEAKRGAEEMVWEGEEVMRGWARGIGGKRRVVVGRQMRA